MFIVARFVVDFITGGLFKSEVIGIHDFHRSLFALDDFQFSDIEVAILSEIKFKLGTLVVLFVHVEVFDKRINEGFFLDLVRERRVTVHSSSYLVHHFDIEDYIHTTLVDFIRFFG